MTLSAQAIEQLEDILFTDEIADETLDYFGLHGLVCSSVVGPVSLSAEQIIEILFGHEKPALRQEDEVFIKQAIHDISTAIRLELLDESDVHLPYIDESESDIPGHYDACLESWCCGFLEGFFAHEKAWFTKGEDVAAELLLPIMALSGLFESDEFEEIRRNNKLMSQFEEVMPDQLVDIFLFYHSE